MHRRPNLHDIAVAIETPYDLAGDPRADKDFRPHAALGMLANLDIVAAVALDGTR